MAGKASSKTTKTSVNVAKKASAKKAETTPTLLSGGNPQIAKGYGD